MYEQDHVTVSIGKDKSGKEKVQAGANLAAVLGVVFERECAKPPRTSNSRSAARLRDEIKRLREMELDVLEAREEEPNRSHRCSLRYHRPSSTGMKAAREMELEVL